MYLYKRIYVKLLVPRQTFLFFLCSVSDVAFLFDNLSEKFETSVAHKRLAYKKACKF